MRWVKNDDLLENIGALDLNDRYSATKIRYTSTFLGIAFTYFTDLNDQNIFIQRTGNEICLSPKTVGDCWGRLKVLKKRPDQTLKEAITKQFLTGYDTKRCYVDDPYTSNDDRETTARNLRYRDAEAMKRHEYARILYSPLDKSEFERGYAFQYCPPEVEEHYARFFIADEVSAPDKFAFDDSGGYPSVEFLDVEFLPNVLEE